MNITSLKERENPERCSAPLCRAESGIVYRAGSTPANPRHTITLCDQHHAKFRELPQSTHPVTKEVTSCS